MIRLMVDNQYQVYLDKGTRLRLEYQMPYFDSEGIPVPIIYPFNIPIKKNVSIFSFAHLTLLQQRAIVFNVTMYFDDIPVLKGKFYIKTLTKDYYRGSIVFNGFSDDFKTKKLNELVYEDIDIGGTPHSATNVAYHAEQIVKGFVEADYTFPVIFAENFYGEPDDDDLTEYNPDWGGDEGSGDVGRYINNYNAAAGAFPINMIREDPLNDNVAAMVPHPFVHNLIRKIFNDENFGCFGSFFDNEELHKLIIFYNFPLDEKYKKYYVQAEDEAYHLIEEGGNMLGYPDETTGENQDVDGCWNNSTNKYTVKNSGYHIINLWLRAKPDYNVNYTTVKCILGLKNELGVIEFEQQFIVDNDLTYHDLLFEFEIFFNTGDINKEYHFWFKFIVGDSTDYFGAIWNEHFIAYNSSYQNLNQFSNILNIANHLPPVEINTFFNTLTKAFGIGIFFDFINNNVQFSLVNDIFNSKKYLDLSHNVLSTDKETEILENNGYKLDIAFDRDVYTFDNYEFIGEFDTWDELPTPDNVNKIALEKSSNTIVIYRKDPDSNIFDWFYWSDNIYPVKSGGGIEPITADFSTLAMHIGNNLLTAQTKVIASSPAFETGDNDFALTLLFYRGMQENADGDEYPMASCVNYDRLGNEIGDYQLKMNGDNGLYAKFLQSWYTFLGGSEEIKRYFHCNAVDFLNITSMFLPQKGVECRKIMVDNMICLPKKATFILTNEGIDQAEIIMLKSNAYTDGR